MSHAATNWAIIQRGLKPATKIVLWHLCDRHHPDHGCFPSQDTLAGDCELSRASLNTHLASLEQAGLIRREQRRNVRTKRNKSTVYRFAFESDFEPLVAEKPCPDSGHGNEAGAVSRNGAEPCPDFADSRVQNLDSNPVREPVREPVSERERASEDLKSEKVDPEPTATHGTWLARLKRVHATWPTFVRDNDDLVRKYWFDLTEAERLAAIEGIEGYKALEQGHKNKTFFQTYLKGKRWLKLEAKAPGSVARTQVVRPFGKLWGAKRFAALMAPPSGFDRRINSTQQSLIDSGTMTLDAEMRRRQARYGWPGVITMHDRAINHHKGDTAPTSLKPLECLFVSVNVGTALWDEWGELHREKGWPWIEGTWLPKWVYMPETPELDAPADDLVRLALENFERAHAALTMGHASKEAAE